MSERTQELLEDIEFFEELHKEEMKMVEGRQSMNSQVVAQKAIAPTIVRYINNKLNIQGKKNGRTRNQSSSEEK